MKQRIITAIIALAVVIPFLLYGDWPFVIFAYIIAAVGLLELLKMRQLDRQPVAVVLGILMLLIVLSNFSNGEIPYLQLPKLNAIMVGVILLFAYTVLSKNRFTFDDAGFILITVFYVGMGFFYLIETRMAGLDYLFFVFFVVWSTDSGAYFVGKAVGKNKLWPIISPNKTIEGALGGVVIATIVGVVFQIVHPFDVSMMTIIGVSLLTSVAGQIGDLVESAFKRHYDVKDSGNLLPGHGGVLDRLDSLIFVFPILHFIQFI